MKALKLLGWAALSCFFGSATAGVLNFWPDVPWFLGGPWFLALCICAGTTVMSLCFLTSQALERA